MLHQVADTHIVLSLFGNVWMPSNQLARSAPKSYNYKNKIFRVVEAQREKVKEKKRCGYNGFSINKWIIKLHSA